MGVKGLDNGAHPPNVAEAEENWKRDQHGCDSADSVADDTLGLEVVSERVGVENEKEINSEEEVAQEKAQSSEQDESWESGFKKGLVPIEEKTRNGEKQVEEHENGEGEIEIEVERQRGRHF